MSDEGEAHDPEIDALLIEIEEAFRCRDAKEAWARRHAAIQRTNEVIARRLEAARGGGRR